MFDNSSNVAISVLDDESDDHGRMRARARRKRKKFLHRGDSVFALRLLRKLLKYWMLLIIIPVFGFLVFEAFIIGTKPSLKVSSQLGTPNEPSQFDLEFSKVNQSTTTLVKNPKNNLNRLDSTTRVIGGVRHRCLKLLPPEELEHLDIPVKKDSRGPVNKVLYISESDPSSGGGNTAFTQQHLEVTRFNLFTGNQTLRERESSFQVKETMMLHCGFYSSAGGFQITDKDKSYMNACRVVVCTCAFGGGDNLYQPIGMSEASLKKVCYVAFWDEITIKAQELVGHRKWIGKWRVVVVRGLPFSDQRLNGKIPKMLSHRLFPQAEYSIWVDSKSQFRRDPLGVLEALLWRSNSVLAISEHGARGSVYDEAKAVVKKNKATPEEVEVQINQYWKDGLPDDKRFNGKKALSEASIIVRKHTPLTNLLMCLWFNEVVRFTSRDQLSFPYVLWRLKAYQNVNLFPVCTRKDLVNSMGHLRKVKPL